MSKILKVKLSKSDRTDLEKMTRSGVLPAREFIRAKILLLADQNQKEYLKQGEIKAQMAVCITTVGRVCRKYVTEGLVAALQDEPRSGAPRKITGDVEAYMTQIACSSPPEGYGQWTLRLIRDELIRLEVIDSISHVAVGNTLKKNELKPWQVVEWCVPKESTRFVAKMEDILSVYTRPYNAKRPIVCIDEKSKELRSEVRETIPMKVGQAQRQDSEYGREGTANLFLCVEPLIGKYVVRVTEHRCAKDFAYILQHLADKVYPDAEIIVIVVDNLNTHGAHCLYETFPAAEARRLAERFEWHFTPEHGSWLNIAECGLSVLSRQCLSRRIPDIQTLMSEVAAWEQASNSKTHKIDWQFTTHDARIKLKRLYPVL
jgi:transposase